MMSKKNNSNSSKKISNKNSKINRNNKSNKSKILMILRQVNKAGINSKTLNLKNHRNYKKSKTLFRFNK